MIPSLHAAPNAKPSSGGVGRFASCVLRALRPKAIAAKNALLARPVFRNGIEFRLHAGAA